MQPENIDFLLACFDTSEIELGRLYWRERPAHHFNSPSLRRCWNNTHAGKRVGRWVHGHRQIGVTHPRLGTVLILEHRLIWLLTYNEAPPTIIDHINRIPFDNRPSNLRDVTQVENIRNSIRFGDSKGEVVVLDDGKFLAVFEPREGDPWQLTFDHEVTAQAAVNYLSYLYEDAFDLAA